MILRNAAFILSFVLFIPFAKAMEAPEEWEFIGPKLQPVTAYLFQDQDGLEGAVSLQTPNFYMSFRRFADLPEHEDRLDRDLFPLAFAPCDLRLDQAIQNSKLGHSGNWPYETVTLSLYTEPMEEMWKELLKGSVILQDTLGEYGYALENIRYVNKKMESDFKTAIDRTSNDFSYNDPLLYFTNISMAFGLLGKGGWFAENLFYIKYPKYFIYKVNYPSLSGFYLKFISAIEKNYYTRAYSPTVDDFSETLQVALKRRKFIRIHRSLERYEIPSLPSARQNVIINMVDHNNSQEEIDKHLLDLKTLYHSQQSKLSPTGWINTIFYGGEW